MSNPVRFGLLFGVLLGGNVAMGFLPSGQPVPLRQDFAQFPARIGGWVASETAPLGEAESRVLGADDYLLRFYDRDGTRVGLFIAYYRSQRSGDALHSPKNCLPGAGWAPVASEVVQIPAVPAGFEANHYVIEKEGVRQDVFYWYQANRRAFASEYRGKVYLVWDALTRQRTDGALVRITAGRPGGAEIGPQPALDFAQELSRILPEFLPN